MAVSRDSIHKATLKAAHQIRAALKKRGIEIAEVDGGHDSDAGLRGLQELQSIGQALNEADAADAARTSVSTDRFGGNDTPSGSTSMSGSTSSTGKK